MLILLISANPLFTEAIEANLSERLGTEVIAKAPAEAMACIQQHRPEVILVDEAAPIGLVEQILKAERDDATRVRLVLLSCTGNGFTLLDIFHSKIVHAEDLSELIKWP
jgi:DNA-binding NarL/FixJ family response regulator